RAASAASAGVTAWPAAVAPASASLHSACSVTVGAPCFGRWGRRGGRWARRGGRWGRRGEGGGRRGGRHRRGRGNRRRRPRPARAGNGWAPGGVSCGLRPVRRHARSVEQCRADDEVGAAELRVVEFGAVVDGEQQGPLALAV